MYFRALNQFIFFMSRTKAWLILVLIIAISLFFLFQVLNIQFKYNFELFYPKNDPNTTLYRDFQRRFHSDKDFILVGLVNKAGIYNEHFLRKTNALTKKLEKIDNVVSVTSPCNAKTYKILPLYPGIYKQQVLRFDQPEYYAVDSARMRGDPNYFKTIVSEDAKSACVVIVQKDDLTQDESFKISDDVVATLSEFEFDETHVAGRSIGKTVYVRLIRDEMRLFVGSSVFLILIFLYISYRRFWGLWMPTVVVLLTVLWTIGLMAFTSKPIDLISNVIPTMLLVIGISNIIHLLSRILDHMREGLGKSNSLKLSIKEVGIATLFTSVTTAIGFMSLTTSNVQPVIDMGIYTSVGLAFSFFLTYTLFPAMVVLNKRLDAKSIEKTENFWYSHLEDFYSYLFNRKKRILVIWAVITVITGIAAGQLRVNSYLLDGLNDENPQRKAFRFFEANFAGSRPFEVSIQLLGDGDIMSLENIRALDSIQNYLDTAYDVGSITSPVTLIKNFNRTTHAGSMDFYKLPHNKNEHEKLLSKLETYGKKLNVDHFVDRKDNYARVNGRMLDEGSIILKEKNKHFNAFMDTYFSTRFKATFTGAAVMMDNTHAYIVANVARGLVGAILLIGMIMGFLFRSWRIVIISLVTNIIPLIITAGIMALNGIEMRLSTSVIFIISFGIAVDDTIHFLSKFKHEILSGKTKLEAIKKTYTTTGKAIIVTTLIISGGFLTLSFSNFLGTHYLGVYISLTLFIALLSVLTVLPTSLLLFLPDHFKKSDEIASKK